MNIYVGNLPHAATEAELLALFSTHGQVESVSMITDRETGRARGFAFVEMADSGSAQKAIAALDGTELGGRALKINEAQPKADRPRGGGQRFSRERGATGHHARGGRREPRW
jgi:RNA recognition motif-containing protein